MSRRLLVPLFLAAALIAATAPAVDATSIGLNPNSPLVIAQGSTNGWGYTIVNDDPERDIVWYGWILAADLTAAPAGTTVSVSPFDFPDVPAGSVLALPYGGGFGLVEITVPVTAMTGDVITGSVYGSLLLVNPNVADDFFDVFFEIPIQAVVPEPAGLLLLGTGLAWLVAARARRR